MSRSALSIWKDGLLNIPDLPSCPSGMTEPQYVALIFEPICTVRLSIPLLVSEKA